MDGLVSIVWIDLNIFGPIVGNVIVVTLGLTITADAFVSSERFGRSRHDALVPYVVEPDIFHGAVIIHQVCEFGHGPRPMAGEVLEEPIVLDVNSECYQGLSITVVWDLVFPCQETRPILADRLTQHLPDEGQIPRVWRPGAPGAVLAMGIVPFDVLGSDQAVVRPCRGMPCVGNVVDLLHQTRH